MPIDSWYYPNRIMWLVLLCKTKKKGRTHKLSCRFAIRSGSIYLMGCVRCTPIDISWMERISMQSRHIVVGCALFALVRVLIKILNCISPAHCTQYQCLCVYSCSTGEISAFGSVWQCIYPKRFIFREFFFFSSSNSHTFFERWHFRCW